jgi:hypothetical protein
MLINQTFILIGWEWCFLPSANEGLSQKAYAYAMHELLVAPPEQSKAFISPAVLAAAHDPPMTADEFLIWIRTGQTPEPPYMKGLENAQRANTNPSVGSHLLPSKINRGAELAERDL